MMHFGSEKIHSNIHETQVLTQGKYINKFFFFFKKNYELQPPLRSLWSRICESIKNEI